MSEFARSGFDGVGGFRAALIGEVEVEVVGGDESREEIGEDADGIVFAEDEIGEKTEGAGEAEIPEGAGDDGLFGFARCVHLDEPASGKHEDASVADEFHRGDDEAADLEPGLIHGRSLQRARGWSITQMIAPLGGSNYAEAWRTLPLRRK